MTKFKVLIVMLMAIILANCASTAPEAIFMPKESENVFPFFAKGQAIAAVRSDKSFILLSLDRTRVAGLTYLRLWILYKNLSEEPYLLEPLRFVTVRITSLKNQKEGLTR